MYHDSNRGKGGEGVRREAGLVPAAGKKTKTHAARRTGKEASNIPQKVSNLFNEGN